MKDLKATAYMCGTDLKYEMQDDSMFGKCSIFPNPNQATLRACSTGCGVAEVEVKFVKWLIEPSEWS